jgi:hypothetical protein
MANLNNERVLARLDQHLRECYGNSTAQAVQQLDDAIFMLFFLMEDALLQIEIVDVLGNLVYQGKAEAQPTLNFDISNLSKGSYFIRIDCNEHRITRPLIVQ